MTHFAIAVYGSAGDIFPSIAVAQGLRRRGHEVTFLSPPALGLYPRSAGFRSISVGDGSEFRALEDRRVFTTRFDGFSSWRRLADRYLADTLNSTVERAARQIESVGPNVMIVHPFAFFGSIIASRLLLPTASLHLYPQLSPEGRSSRSINFGGRFARRVRELERAGAVRSSANPFLDLGWCEVTLSVHDPAVVRRTPMAERFIGELCGFPYWDDVTVIDRDQEALDVVRSSTRPVLVATLGSFTGQSQLDFWKRMKPVIEAIGCTALLMGVPATLRSEMSSRQIVCTGFVPMSMAAPLADLIVHHGGIGTMYAALLAGRRSVVVPHAFDQSFNGRILESIGQGTVVTSTSDLEAVVKRELLNSSSSSSAAPIAGELVSPLQASDLIAHRLISWAASATQVS